MSKTEFQIGQEVDWARQGKDTPAVELGEGSFVVKSLMEVPQGSIRDVGHSQWVILAKQVSLGAEKIELIFDPFAHQWVLPENLSDFGKVHPTRLSGFWLS